MTVNQGDLPEDVWWVKSDQDHLVSVFGRDVDLDQAFDHHEQRLGDVSLVEDELPLLEGALDGPLGELPQRFFPEVAKQPRLREKFNGPFGLHKFRPAISM